jgi:bifunctional non-homologous end joining protein LigD
MRGDEKRENWLLIKEDDNSAGRNGASEHFLEKFDSSVKSGRSMEEIAEGTVPPRKTANNTAGLEKLIKQYPDVQLATLVEVPPPGDDWLHEIKFDGYRLLGYFAGGDARLRTRNGKDWSSSFPAITAALEHLKVKSAVFDMEAVVVDAEGKSSFQALQAALAGGGDRNRITAYVFDLLHLDGRDLTASPLTERKEQLKKLLASHRSDNLHYSDHVAGNGEAMFAKACATGVEGIISKKADDPYTTGRTKTWLKTKCIQREEFIILGSSKARTGDRALGALYLGYNKGGDLCYAGKAGTGFTMQSARELAERLEKIRAGKALLPRSGMTGVPAGEWRSIQWVKPTLLCEIAFTEWTADGRIRHPSFQGLREDKKAAEVKKEVPVQAAQKLHLELAGIKISHPDRVISEAGNVTKGELAEYYAAVARFLLPSVARHPVSLLRCPSGVDGTCFYQRNPGRGLGVDVHTFDFRHKGKNHQYLYIEDEKGLLETVQMGAVELHPWGATIDAIDYPDRLIFDLDPAPDVLFEPLKLAAQDLRQRLKRKGLDARLKVTGGKGLHVIVPLAARNKWAEVKSFAASIGEEMEADAPEAYVATMSRAKRTGRIFIDYFRNDYTATAIADYAVRARPGTPVAVPIDWRELEGLESPDQFTMKDVLQRLKKKSSPGSNVKAQSLPAAS